MTKLYMVRRDGGKDEYLDTSKDDCDSWRVAGDADLHVRVVASDNAGGARVVRAELIAAGISLPF